MMQWDNPYSPPHPHEEPGQKSSGYNTTDFFSTFEFTFEKEGIAFPILMASLKKHQNFRL